MQNSEYSGLGGVVSDQSRLTVVRIRRRCDYDGPRAPRLHRPGRELDRVEHAGEVHGDGAVPEVFRCLSQFSLGTDARVRHDDVEWSKRQHRLLERRPVAHVYLAIQHVHHGAALS